MNPVLVAMLACDRQHLMGAPVTDMFDAADQPTVSELLARASGATARAEANLRRPDGVLVPVLLAATCLDLDGVLVRFLIATDLTAHKETHRALAAANRALAKRAAELDRSNYELGRQSEELARSNRDLEQFAFIASHDLQEPVRMVASYRSWCTSAPLATA